MKKIKYVTVLIGLFLFPIILCAQSVSDYLILQNIGSYKFSTQSVNPVTDEVKQIPGYTILKNSGVLAGADHFKIDHKDTTYETDYESDVTDIGVEVKVTQHTGGDSDRWLLHELDAEFRTYYGIPGKSYGPEKIDGNTILQDDVAGVTYRWLSGNKVIEIKYRDPQMTKTEPLEVVKAYLAKHPSTIMPFTLQELRNNSNKTKWIKDEFDRRLWLCDKWTAQYQAGAVKQSDLIVTLVKNLDIFLKYRWKYFGVGTAAEADALDTYQQANDLTSIQNKLTEYKTWWNANKGKVITLP